MNPTPFFAKKTNIYLLVGILAVIIIVSIFLFGSSGNTGFPLFVKKENFVNTISITGKAIFDQRSDLGFDKTGRISAIYKSIGDKVSKGDIIASIDNSDINAELASKQAAVDRERSRLDSALQGTRPEQLQIYQQSYSDSVSALITAIRSSYLKSENALLQEVDTVFLNGESVNPTITVRTDGDTKKKNVEKERLLAQESMSKWNAAISTYSADSSEKNLTALVNQAGDSLKVAKILLDDLGKIVIDINTGNSGMLQTEIDTVRTNINSAAQNISSASISFETSRTAFNTAKDTLNLAQSGTTNFDIDAQKASLRSAEADLATSRAKFSQTTISAPFNGIVSRIDTKIGEVVSPAESPVSIINTSSLILEAYVPEIDVDQLKVNDPAKITFDAFGSAKIYSGSVNSIDLTETMRDNISTYKIQVKIDQPSENIRSGMTSDIVITTNTKDSVITIPTGYIIKEGGKYFVLKDTGKDRLMKTEVTIAEIGSMSRVEIVSGLTDGDSIMSPAATSI